MEFNYVRLKLEQCGATNEVIHMNWDNRSVSLKLYLEYRIKEPSVSGLFVVKVRESYCHEH